jgi:CRISPR type III-A-associated RAMP protein Csm5
MSLSNTLGTSFTVSIQLLTPLHIGNGDTLSPYADYALDKNKNVCLLDTDALAGALFDTNQVNQYMQRVLATEKESKELVLNRFVQHNMGSDINAFMTGKILPGSGIENPILINRCIVTDGEAYIPGSTFKGAIMQTLMHKWLYEEADDKAKEVLNAFCNKIGKHYTNYQKDLDYIYDTKEGDERKRAIKNLRNKFGKMISDDYNIIIETPYLNPASPKEKMMAACIRVNDTNSIADATGIYRFDRYRLIEAEEDDRGKDLGVLLECVTPGKKFSTSIAVDLYNYTDKSFHSKLSFIKEKKDFFSLINQMSLQLITYEIGVLEGCKMNEPFVKACIADLAEYAELINQNNPHKAYIRIGHGKMQFHQTIAMAIFKNCNYDEANQDWINYLWYSSGMKNTIPDIFPVTRTLTRAGYKGAGWTELS